MDYDKRSGGLRILGFQWEGEPALNVKCSENQFPYVEGFGGNALRCKVVQIDGPKTNLAFVPQ